MMQKIINSLDGFHLPRILIFKIAVFQNSNENKDKDIEIIVT